MRRKGKISSWNDDKGFGFISPADGAPDLFVHISAFRNASRRPSLSDVVTFEISKDKQGRPCAERAILAGDEGKPVNHRKSGATSIVVALAFLFVTFVSTVVTVLPHIIPLAYLLLSVLTFVIYGFDKSAARRGRWRTAESTLHLLALVGGWPGALIAQQTLRHKSHKRGFRVVFWLTVVLNCGGFAWLHTSAGQEIVAQLLHPM